MNVTHFESSQHFRRWLVEHHDKSTELWVAFYKKASGKGGITYSEAVDEALCFGWIDGIKKRVDGLSYTHRFSPRKSKSTWSLINIKRVEGLIAAGRMTPVGQKAFEARVPHRMGIYSFENLPRELDPALQRQFKGNKLAWGFFQAQPPGYRRLANWWVMSAKKDETRQRRLDALVTESAKGLRIGVVNGKSGAKP
jgi:uncharacterized protein YdeI (YjbR/CyaY-like superfamily)